ncbi:protein CASP-like [Pollicipes pollicipes]|uniref:protein CASP-like n=1 Tax=Pollicipes pollicipes TaxID=41117 RepID=UPI001884D5DE|nr:protein CASP-like [Pollicipes pollicipes]
MGTKVMDLVQEWKKFGLSGLQSELDDVAAQIATRQDESEVSRRALVELTRDFRKNTPEDVRKMIAPLLKSFQSEVDSLCNRSKGAETAFLNVYKKLIDMPDITPALEFSLSAQQKLAKLAELQLENSQLRDTLSSYTAELKDVRSQDVTIKQLKEEIRQHETKQESVIEARVRDLERDLLREFQEREQTYHDEQLLLTRRLGESEHKIAQLTSDLELSQSELFEVKAKYEENSHARSDELDMVLVDLERANQRAALAEREVDTLKEQLAVSVKRAQLADEGDVGSDSQRRSVTERQLASKDNEISQLVEDVQRLQSQLTELENQSVCQRAKLEEELEQKSNVIQRLEAIIEQQKDYEELKKEFSILKSIEFPGTSQSSTADERSLSGAKPLEVLMLEKSKAMQNENTALKVKTGELQARCETLQLEQERHLRTIEEQRRLVQKLEDDLGSMNSMAMICRGEGEGQPSSSELVAEAVRDTMHSPPAPARPASVFGSDPSSPSDTILPIVSAQRERFRHRIQELEQERYMLQHELGLKESDIDDLRRDNLKLFEKIKYLQSYSAQKSSSQDVESRYSSQYEDSLDPFSSFSRRERSRKYAQLSPFEKITLSMGQLVLSSKGARTAAFLYTLLLHLLVFAVLYKMAYSEMYRREISSDCAERYAEHMMKIHGEHAHV